MNIFQTIRNQLVKNEIFGNEPKFKLECLFYPEKVIVYLTKNKVFKVAKCTKEYDYDKKVFVYTIEYKDLYTGSDFLEKAYEAEKYHRERAEKKGFLSNEPVTSKFLNINDKYRAELECNNWSSEKDETGYKECPNNTSGYEKLSPEDNSCRELVLNMLGYDNYKQFCEDHPELSIEQCQEELQKELEYFYQTSVAEDWEIGREESEVLC